MVLVAASIVAAVCIFSTQRTRYRRSSAGINAENLSADLVAVFSLSAVVLLLAALSAITVLFFEL